LIDPSTMNLKFTAGSVGTTIMTSHLIPIHQEGFLRRLAY
jgi:hypothetical protein